ncbi:MAG: hypothetical protein DDT21_02549 [Syntrophomonadaceae bacterium]|nr:hypothetical protein [Bacillota bacterium]
MIEIIFRPQRGKGSSILPLWEWLREWVKMAHSLIPRGVVIHILGKRITIPKGW